MNSELDKIFQKIIAVHLTNYFPTNGIIKTKFFTNPKTWFIDTIHFTLNQPISGELKRGTGQDLSWKNLKFVFLIPFHILYKESGDRLAGFEEEDTFFMGNIQIPKSSTIVIFNDGLEDVIKENIISKEEIASHIGKGQKIINKNIEGIEYIIYPKLGLKEINKKEFIVGVIEKKGYTTSGINFREISKKINLSSHHPDHWSWDLTHFKFSIDFFKEYANYFIQAILKLREAGYTYPIYYYDSFDGKRLFNFYTNRRNKYYDAKNKDFDPQKIMFTEEETLALKIFYESVYVDQDISRAKFQEPFDEARKILKIVPDRYYTSINVEIEEYKEVLRRIPKPLIALCPHLQEYLK
ncbi:hypothetical protein J4467_02300 [Candidatus Woesearchaeota archaeon]|nr:hypothetical protein [Candidatus Woesearchaeota archaeon]